METGPLDRRDEAAVTQFVQRFAATLTNAGWPRMPARVFVALSASESGVLTAAELSEQLGISAAAVSNAVRFLTQLGMVSRERPPGARRDNYRVHGDSWARAIRHREALLASWKFDLETGVVAVGVETAAGKRLAESVGLLNFLEHETADMMRRWEERRPNHG